MYHHEAGQEDFLLLGGRALAIAGFGTASRRPGR
jgi:hypothetical protein